MTAFDRLADFIKDYIYANNWTELRENQVAACDVIFNTDCNLLLASGTASGKTEAAFLPCLTDLYEHPSYSVGILYISPLKALINDQFCRLNDLLDKAYIPVTKWHGDANTSKKTALLKKPSGVVQITPESLESLLLNRGNEINHLFSDLRYIVIDEVHYFMGNDRGIQLLCDLERINRLTGTNPRRIGLSATLGDYHQAEKWLNSSTGRKCITPSVSAEKKSLRLMVDSFTYESDDEENGLFPFYASIYKNTLGRKSLIFANSKAEVEFTIANLKKIAAANHTPDFYRVHHGNISAAFREQTEKEMKESDEPIVTGATVTLELGIDIGALDRIVQINSPLSVSSFVQRLGRCGRRGNPAEMYFAYKLEEKVNRSEIEWDFVRCIAIIELYLKEKWIEPNNEQKLPLSMLYHQTMSHIACVGEASPASLAQYILTLTPFRNVSKDDYKQLLYHLIDINHLQKTENNGLMLGLAGEKVVNHFEFYSVFETMTEYSVRYKGRVIGTVMSAFNEGQIFSLCGLTWKVVELSEKNRTIFVQPSTGLGKVHWIDFFTNNVHWRVVRKMAEILACDEQYKYLSKKSIEILNQFRCIAKNDGILTSILIRPENSRKAEIFPWLGTSQLAALSLALYSKGFANTIKDISLTIDCSSDEKADDILNALKIIKSNGVDTEKIEVDDDMIIPAKYNRYIPIQLLNKQYICDYIDSQSLKKLLGV